MPPSTPIDLDALEPLLTSDETAQLLRIKRKSLWENRRLGRGPQPTKVGRRLLYNRDEVLAFAGLALAA